MGIPFINDPFATALTRYPKKIKPPGVEPDSSPAVQVPISCAWLPYVAGACKALLQEATWDTTTTAELETVLGQAANLLFIFSTFIESEACGGAFAPFSCPYDFTQLGSGADGFTNQVETGYVPAHMGDFTSGIGWVGSVMTNSGSGRQIDGIAITKNLGSAIPMSTFGMDFDVTYGIQGFSPTALGIRAFHLGIEVANVLYNMNVDTNGHKTLRFTGAPFVADRIDIDIRAGENPTGAPLGSIFLDSWGYSRAGGGAC